jgi:hypothetical protein
MADRYVLERELTGPYPDNPGWTRPRSYDVSPDGERFLMTKRPASPGPESPWC